MISYGTRYVSMTIVLIVGIVVAGNCDSLWVRIAIVIPTGVVGFIGFVRYSQLGRKSDMEFAAEIDDVSHAAWLLRNGVSSPTVIQRAMRSAASTGSEHVFNLLLPVFAKSDPDKLVTDDMLRDILEKHIRYQSHGHLETVCKYKRMMDAIQKLRGDQKETNTVINNETAKRTVVRSELINEKVLAKGVFNESLDDPASHGRIESSIASQPKVQSKESMLLALEELSRTSDVLLNALSLDDEEKSHEAISVILMQGIELLGRRSTAFQQFLPVWEAIRSHIDRGDLSRALGQAQTWKAQLLEVISLVRQH